jgi:hypothetical protein
MKWLEQMKGKHKQLYDLGAWSLAEDGRPLRFCKNFLDTFRDVYKMESPDVNTAVGVSGPAFALNATDRLWEKYRLGERSKIIDPKTKQPSTRNIFYDEGSDISVKAMQARGTIFWQCNVALGNVAQQLADQFKMPFAEVRSDLICRAESGRQADAVTRNGARARPGAGLHLHAPVSDGLGGKGWRGGRAFPTLPAFPALLPFPPLRLSRRSRRPSRPLIAA